MRPKFRVFKKNSTIELAIGSAGLTVTNMTEQQKQLLHIILDMVDWNGGHLPSTEADLMFREAFCDFGETTKEGLLRMLKGDWL